MYINVKERKNKKDIKVYYLYVCESNRVEGKVVNKQRYFGSISETYLRDMDLTPLDESFGKEEWEKEELEKVNVKLGTISLNLKNK